ncbi:DEAD/DEAH box helicase [Archangium lansingense]|uniref:DEAD/DEAH box helicase n=1 Tax=Archangium lansingense TaxID=2995310 RepID=A0ABT4AIZ4_9BACT|nr:DEAD/DEAH box helicase [Archangium lansinium]MCY1081677.1 DEAD/DEAH box helicase [Archangium lansinium]
MPKALPQKLVSLPGRWLRHWLTREQLHLLAGDDVYSRGKSLAAKGRVLSWLAAEDVLHGAIRSRGGGHLPVSVSANEQGLLGNCPCSSFQAARICEHVVALGLAVLEAITPEEGGTSSAGKEEPLPRTPEEVSAWLEAHHVSHLRSITVSELESLLPRGFSIIRRLYLVEGYSVVSILDGSRPLPDSWSEKEQEVFRRAAWLRARVEAQRVSLGLEQERNRRAPPRPTDARLVPLEQLLQQERARVREHAVPRLLPDNERLLYFPENRPVAHVHESGYGLSRTSTFSEHFHHRCVRVDLPQLLDGEEGACSCSICPSRGPARCRHALTALDLLLAALGDSRRAAENARLADRLFVAPARELLAAMDRVGLEFRVRRESSSTTAQVSFHLEGFDDGEPRLRPYLHRSLKRGGLSKGTQVAPRDEAEARAALVSSEEVEAFELCRLVSRMHDPGDRRRVLVQALKLLEHHPRLVLESKPEVPLRVRSVLLGFAIEEDEEAQEGLRVRPTFGGESVPMRVLQGLMVSRAPQPWLYVEHEPPRVSLVSASPEALVVLGPVVEYGGRLPASARGELLRRLGGVESAFPLSLSASLEAREVPAEPGLLLRLRPTGGESLEGELLVRPLSEGPPLVPGEGADVVRGLRGRERVMARRNLEAERNEAAALLERLGLPVESRGYFTLEGPEAALGFLERLEPLTGPSLRVEWEERPWSVVRSPDARGLKVEVHRERDWFGVQGGVELEGERVELAVLLDALRRGHRYVPLAPGRWMKLTEALREQLSPLADVAHPSRGKWEVSAAAASALDGLAEVGAQVEAPPDWRRLAGRIREAQTMKVSVPANLKARLRDYQREGFVWMARLAAWGGGGCLADDMGLGKTLQALALLLHRAEAGPALVVAPTSVCFNWVREAARFAPSLKVHAYREAEREELLSGLGAGDVVVVSYSLLMREARRFSEVSFATLVLDEAQAVKNPDTARAKAVRALNAEARMALSGTPVENRLSELWSLYRLIFPGLLGSRESFRERFAGPIERTKDPQARAALARVVRPFLLRRTKVEVARELPPRLETVVPITLSEGERRLYEDTRLAALARLADARGPKKRFEVLAALTRLRLAACHPRLVDADSPLPSSKLERLLEVVESVRAEGGRALVFSQFVKHLALVREALEARGVPLQYLDGQTPAADRETRVTAFQQGEGDVFLISLKAGGTGLNLTAADHVLHLDPWWNPAVEDQATDRAHRIGQTKPVTVTRLISEGTIEEAILALHEEKRDLANSLLSEADGAAALSTEQLLGLLRYGPEGEGSAGESLATPPVRASRRAAERGSSPG